LSDDALIERFYDAFGRRDGTAMAACYAPNAHFSDPVFTDLRGPEVGAMWRMLTERGADLRIELLEHEEQADRGTARWRAHYTFSQTGRRWSTTCGPRSCSPTAGSRITATSSTSTAGPARRSGRPASCWAGRRCFGRP
jgi:SnoaL-like domain